ncbi:hypothetical protein SO802_000080 [Lithocarpus litseifolius]|uniref:Uncharacterized protein n=1 Tax=Lithocarpus litseifolius TaxID=425828 RepID=A0AAW2DWB3_9ROSI
MSFAHLLNTEASLASFRQTFNIPEDVNVAYCHESEIALHRGPNVAFFPLMAILEGEVRFPVNLLLLSTLRFYGLSPEKLPPNFYRVVSCVDRLNQIYGLQLDHNDINHMYSLCGNKRTNYYLKVKDMRVRLISCLPDSNKNSAGEFVRVSGNWFADDAPCPLSRREVDGRVFTPDIRSVHVRDLNFVLRSEIFVHTDGQLRASHLILGCIPVYRTWQPFSQALLVDSPLLSYIDVRHANFLPPSLTVGEARDIGPRYITADDLPPVRDESAERVSRLLRERAHVPVEQGNTESEIPQTHIAEGIRTTTPADEMVTRKTLTVDRFLPGPRQQGQQQQARARDRSPPPPPARQKKKQRVEDPPPRRQGDASSKTPPRPSGGIVIREPAGSSQPAIRGVAGRASSSRQAPSWQPTFSLGNEPLPATASLRLWAQGEGGRVAHSLASGLMLPADVQFFRDGTEESIAKRLQWHTIAAAQITHVLGERMNELAEDAEREKALREVAAETARERSTAAENAERRAQSEEKAKQQAERRVAELKEKLSGLELKLAQAESLAMAHADEVADLKATLEACEEKWYNEGFADAENSVEPVVSQARAHGFEEGWLAALRAVGVPGGSPFWISENIPRPTSLNPVQSQAIPADEGDTPSMRELVRAIDTHVEDLDLEVSSALNAPGDEELRQPPTEENRGQEVIGSSPPSPLNPAT